MIYSCLCSSPIAVKVPSGDKLESIELLFVYVAAPEKRGQSQGKM